MFDLYILNYFLKKKKIDTQLPSIDTIFLSPKKVL